MIDRVINNLKMNKIPITPQRFALVEILVNNRIHPTFNELYKLIKNKIKNTTKAALYNNIEILEKNGVIFEFSIYGKKHYDIIIEDHDHFVCLHCEGISDIAPHEAKEAKVSAGDVVYKSTFYFGICNKCKKKGSIL